MSSRSSASSAGKLSGAASAGAPSSTTGASAAGAAAGFAAAFFSFFANTFSFLAGLAAVLPDLPALHADADSSHVQPLTFAHASVVDAFAQFGLAYAIDESARETTIAKRAFNITVTPKKKIRMRHNVEFGTTSKRKQMNRKIVHQTRMKINTRYDTKLCRRNFGVQTEMNWSVIMGECGVAQFLR
jgi:hypothetical protein